MASLKSLIVLGVSRFIGDVIGERFIKSGGTSSQFLKADGSVDSTTYYSKPATGIPNSDLASDVQNKLSLANTALQSFTETDPTVPSHVKNITSQDITNWNNKLSSAPVTSVNGQTGAVNLNISTLVETTLIKTLKNEPDSYLKNVQYNVENNNVSYIEDYVSSSIVGSRTDQPLSFNLPNPESSFRVIFVTPTENKQAEYIYISDSKANYYNLIPASRYFYRDSDGEQQSFVLESGRRFIWASNVLNVRDLGGIPTKTNGYIAYDKIIRGSELDGHYVNADDMGIEAMRSLHFTLELDLRNDSEINNDHSEGQSEFATRYKKISFIRFENIRTLDNDEKAKIKDAFETVANEVISGGKVYIHCAWSYHRAGFLATLIEGILGATQYEIDKDYELSSFSPLGVVKRTDSNYKNGITAINEQYDGSWAKFAKACGISEELIESFRKAMIVEVQNCEDPGNQYIEVTYDELKKLRDNKNLIPGAKYRMIDFDTYDGGKVEVASCSGIPDLSEFKSAYHHFDLLLTALSTNELDSNVKALHSARDTEGYFTNQDLSKWEIKYDLDNDKSKYSWAVNEENGNKGKGVIYYMKDEYNNEVPYDFKNIMFRRPYLIFNHEYVDLGLPSGTLWATCNVGANSPEEYGDYFAWGETTTKSMYDWSSYFDTDDDGSTFKKYNNDGGKTELDPEDDAAAVNWGGSWRIPSRAQIQELYDISNTTTEWTQVNGVNGRKITSKSNGNSIFLPAAGGCYNRSLLSAGSSGYYLSRSFLMGSNDSAYILYFYQVNIFLATYSRDIGRSVRAVLTLNKDNKDWTYTFDSPASNVVIKPWIDNLGLHLNKNIFVNNSMVKDCFFDFNTHDNIMKSDIINVKVGMYSNNNTLINLDSVKLGLDNINVYLENFVDSNIGNVCYNLELYGDTNVIIVEDFVFNKSGGAVGEYTKIYNNIEYSPIEDLNNLTKIYYTNGDKKLVKIVGTLTRNDLPNFNNIKKVEIGSSVSSIVEDAFNGCSSLTSIIIPNSVTSIGISAFYDCSSLTSVTFGNGIKSIGNSAFYGCSNLQKVIVPDIAAWCSIHFSISKSDTSYYIGTNPLEYSHHLYSDETTEITQLVIPEGVISIGEGQFFGCRGLISVTIPNSITSIDRSAFNRCTSLTSVNIPEGVTSIGSYAFYNCSSLTSVNIPEGVTSIGDYAFSYCSSLTYVTCLAVIPPTLTTGTISSNVMTIKVPAQSVDAYKSASGWSNYASKIVAIQL